jgi:hypothetical protein
MLSGLGRTHLYRHELMLHPRDAGEPRNDEVPPKAWGSLPRTGRQCATSAAFPEGSVTGPVVLAVVIMYKPGITVWLHEPDTTEGYNFEMGTRHNFEMY